MPSLNIVVLGVSFVLIWSRANQPPCTLYCRSYINLKLESSRPPEDCPGRLVFVDLLPLGRSARAGRGGHPWLGPWLGPTPPSPRNQQGYSENWERVRTRYRQNLPTSHISHHLTSHHWWCGQDSKIQIYHAWMFHDSTWFKEYSGVNSLNQ